MGILAFISRFSFRVERALIRVWNNLAWFMAKKGSEKANQNEKPKQQSKLTKTLIGVSTGALAIALGVGAGFLFHALTDQKKTITINAADLKVDEADLMARYKSTSDYSTLEPWEMINISLLLHSQSENSFSYTEGQAIAMGLVKQNIKSSAIHADGKWFEESLSKSEGSIDVQTGWRMYESAEHVTDLFKSKDKSIANDASYATWETGSKKTFDSTDDFKKEVGYIVSKHRSNYNITKYTIIEEDARATSGDGGSKVTKTDIGFDVDIELDITLACEDYKTQMVHTSNLYSRPNFYFSHLTLHCDKDLYPITMEGHEKYHAATSAIISSDVEANMLTHYLRDGGYKIPELNEKTNYQQQ